MIEIKNTNKFPIPIIVRSKKDPHGFTTLNIPGMGAGKNIVYLEDERRTEYMDKVASNKLISVNVVESKPKKGE